MRVPVVAAAVAAPVIIGGMRATLRAWWPPLLAGLATLAYGVGILGFGLVYRPLHHDEGVTLQVAQNASAARVLDVAVNVRHGPPLHYLLVHVSLLWHDDVFGLRLPSALLGILTVAVAYGFGRELLGRSGGALVAVITTVSPIVVHLGQFSRGYTAMLAAAYGSLWLMLLLLRTRRWYWVPAYAVAALLLVSAHPFGLFALLSELIVIGVVGLAPSARRWRESRRSLILPATALVLGAAALIGLQRLYAPLQSKYHVGSGGPVVHLASSAFWGRLGDNAAGSTVVLAPAALAAAVILGELVLIRENRRAALLVAVWIAQPLVLLALFTAASESFAPERHLSFLLPGAAAAVAALVLWVAAHTGRFGPWIAGALMLALFVPGMVADVNDLRNFEPDLRDASLSLADQVGPSDVLLTSAGRAERLADPRLYAAYAVLEAPEGSPLSRWRPVGMATGCDLVRRLGQRAAPQTAWIIMRPPDPAATVEALHARGVPRARQFGSYVVAGAGVPARTVQGALQTGAQMFQVASQVGGGVGGFGIEAAQYRRAAALQRAGRCA
jgi:dolichyl-phosphate-mannose-protein mannosyltransferase